METLSPTLIGLSKFDLSKATASAGDVLNGKTFYSGGSSIIRTGTLIPKESYRRKYTNLKYEMTTTTYGFNADMVLVVIGYKSDLNDGIWCKLFYPYEVESANWSVPKFDGSVGNTSATWMLGGYYENNWVEFLATKF